MRIAWLKVALVSVCVTALTACRSSQPLPTQTKTVTYPGFEWLDAANPEREVADALKRNDRHFIGVYGYTGYTPGVSETSDLPKKYGVRYIEGTTDALKNEQHRFAVERATEYARHYNELLVQKLQAGE
jgi:hypothetical protein